MYLLKGNWEVKVNFLEPKNARGRQDLRNYLAQVWHMSKLKPSKGKGLAQGHTAQQRLNPRLTTLFFAFWQIYRQCQAQRYHYNGRRWWLTPLWDETVSGKGLGPQEAPIPFSLFSGSTLFQNSLTFSFYWVKYPLPLLKKSLMFVLHRNTLISSWINGIFRLSIFRATSLSLFEVFALAPFREHPINANCWWLCSFRNNPAADLKWSLRSLPLGLASTSSLAVSDNDNLSVCFVEMEALHLSLHGL